jgi:hypothetical protein
MALIETIPVKEDYRRKLAQALMREGMSSEPIQHWAQGLARMGQSALGGYEMYQADKRDKETEAGNYSALANALERYSGGSPSAQPSPQRPTASPSAPMTSVNPQAGAVPAALAAQPPKDPTNPNGGMYGGLGWRPLDSDPPPEPTKTAALSPMVPAAAPAPAAPAVPTPTAPEMDAAKAKMMQLAQALRNGSPQDKKMAAELGQNLVLNEFQPRDRWLDERGKDGSFYQRNSLTGERKVIEKSDVLPEEAVTQKERIAKASKPETTINNTVNPVLKGIGDRFNEDMDKARASRDQIKSIHEARRALDDGAITGIGADKKLLGAKVGSLFGFDGSKAENSEVLRSAVGESVLTRAKTLGANPSSTDRDFIRDVVGGNIALEEKTIRRLLDMQERWGRESIKAANATGQKLLSAQPKEFGNVAPLFSVEEPEDYGTWSKNNPTQKPPLAPEKINRLKNKYGLD